MLNRWLLKTNVNSYQIRDDKLNIQQAYDLLRTAYATILAAEIPDHIFLF